MYLLNDMSLFFPWMIERDPGRLSGWNRSTVQLPARPDTGSNFQSGGSAKAAPSWHGGSEQWVQHPDGYQDSLGDGDCHVPPAAGGRGKQVSIHMALHVGLVCVSNLPLSSCLGWGSLLPSSEPENQSRLPFRLGCWSCCGILTWALPTYRLSLWAGELGRCSHARNTSNSVLDQLVHVG